MSIAALGPVLVANRGEIALRILRTVRDLGLKGAAVYHAVDRETPAVRAADIAIEIEGETPVAAYLDGAQIVEKARAAGIGAIHPGYGFLSENAGFARAVAEADMVFVGPTPDAIELMGDKVRARRFVAQRGFPVAPSAIEDDEPASFAERARAVDVPLLIKPAAGGGGKGMRIVRDLAVLDEELARARSEGERYFGDGRLYVERYVERPHHIEVQILGDAHGNVVHLFERECSLQRRFQKIVEESPSPSLSPAQRAEICEVAVGIARAAGYQNAGTVEFIYGDGRFYFLEMNTRLQVEHPVTEAVTGLDLVAEQLRIAAGLPLAFAQDEVAQRGHAIELRIYAEDPSRDFSPTTGTILAYRPPAGARTDSGVALGSRVTTAFDPMLAKLIVHGQDRAEAITKARSALGDFTLLGCDTNIAFLDRLLGDPDVATGRLHTGLIGEKPDLVSEPPVDAEKRIRLLGVAARALKPIRDAAEAVPAMHAAMGGWRN
ncbi:acetyl-CoA carboxylase biotin carboxylase subunit [Sphingopyxis kveilinensis]|uniref:acetyl-CoA carboxylase biotin carboxylase subunit n=1 Tax=Sphingopyxis kveilinensis TaxID=3114367 RepID=UPI0030CAADB8